ncbi:Uncharacterised protein [Vibrio cholerae]|nr:Uncharacterised protein [Vibrio cholerae]
MQSERMLRERMSGEFLANIDTDVCHSRGI